MDVMLKHIRPLENLGELMKLWKTIIIYLVSSKLGTNSKREWQASIVIKTMEMPTFDEFVAFLTNLCRLLETLLLQAIVQSSKPLTRKTNALASLNKNVTCNFVTYLILYHNVMPLQIFLQIIT